MRRFLRGLGLQKKLLLGFAAVALIPMGISSYNHFALRQVSQKYDHVASINLGNAETLAGMNRAMLKISLLVNQHASGLEQEPGAAAREYRQLVEAYQKSDAIYREIPFVDGEQKLYDAVSDGWQKFAKTSNDIFNLPANSSQFAGLLAVYKKHAAQLDESLAGLAQFQSQEALKWREMATIEARTSSQLSMILTFTGFFLALILGYYLPRAITTSIVRVTSILKERADRSAEKCSAASRSSQSVSMLTNEQAVTIQMTVSSVDQLKTLAEFASSCVSRTSDLSTSSQTDSRTGQESMTEMINAINTIKESNSAVGQQVTSLHDRATSIIQEIGEKTKIINDIVFQTKLLSFNASVEAARAGEFGRGFSVVADEIGNLAKLSGVAAKEISEMVAASLHAIDAMVADIRRTVEEAVQNSGAKIDEGVAIAQRCNDTLAKVVQNSQEIDMAVMQLRTVADEQGFSISSINSAMSDLETKVRSSAEAANESAVFADQMNSEFRAVHGLVSSLEQILEGEKKSGSEPPADDQRPQNLSEPHLEAAA